MRIAVCDDNTAICEEIIAWIAEYIKRERLDAKVDAYYHADDLLDGMKNRQWYDIIFLDIEFPDKRGNSLFDKQGIALGEYLRKYVDCNEVIIDFISGRRDYSMELFDLQPINFRVKPLKKEEIQDDLAKACRLLNAKKVALEYEQGNMTKGVLLKNILYIEARDKSIVVHTREGEEIVFRGTLGKIEEQYEQYDLCRCHRAFIVNLQYVDYYKNHQLVLKGNEDVVVDVGKHYVANLKSALSKMDFREE